MKKSISLGWRDCTDLEIMRVVKAAGFDGVDVDVGNDLFLNGDPRERVDEICRVFDQVGIACAQTHLACHPFFSPRGVIDETVEAYIHFGLKATRQLGAKWGVYHCIQDHPDYDHMRALQDNFERVKTYLPTAEKYGTGIALENIPRFPDCPQYDFFGSRIEDLCGLMDALNSPYVSICWDTGHNHLNISLPDKRAAFESLAGRVSTLHVSGNFGNNDWHLCPTLGQASMDDVVPVLIKHGFRGYFNLEVNVYPQNRRMRMAYLHFCGQSADAILSAYGVNEPKT